MAWAHKYYTGKHDYGYNFYMEETPLRTPVTSSISSSTRITHRRSQSFSALVPLAFVAGLMLGYIFWGHSASETHPGVPTAIMQQASSALLPTQKAPVRYNVPVGNNPSIGPENAPITLIEFGDYECPYCKEWFLETYSQLMSTYQGKIRFVYRDFPLTGLHANASPAAEAADCAGEQGKYWPFNDKLFGGDLALGSDTYLKYASDLGLDSNQFKNCLDTNKYQDAVEANYSFAYNLGVQSTPTFFINGLAVVGAQPFSVFKQIIDQELAGQIP
jgi:protein-disulfide isomerase